MRREKKRGGRGIFNEMYVRAGEKGEEIGERDAMEIIKIPRTRKS